MNIALIEPVMTGHRPTYLKYYTRALLKKGHNVFLFCPQDSWVSEQFDIPENGKLHFIDFGIEKKKFRRFSSTRFSLLQWKHLSEKLKKITVSLDFVFFMSLDTFHAYFFEDLKIGGIPLYKYLNRALSIYLDRIFPHKWAGIFLGAERTYPGIFYSKNNVAIGVLEETFRFDQVSLNEKIIGIPDITDTELHDEISDIEEKVFEYAKGRKIISLLGRIHKRKHVLTFLDAADEMSGEELFFLIAGEPALESFSKEEKDRIMNPRRDHYYIYPDRIQDGHEFNSLLRCSSVVFASYKEFNFSSNMLTKCAYFKKPMIVTENTYMADVVNKYNIGLTIREKSVPDTVEAVRKLSNSFDKSEAEFELYYEKHKVERIHEVIDELIQLYEKSN